MKIMKWSPMVSLIAVSLLSGCASGPSEYGYRDSDSYRGDRYRDERFESVGEVVDIDRISRDSRTSGGGAVLGAIIGAAIGNQVGSGRGRAAATGAGAIGGAVIGNEIEKDRARDSDVYRVVVELDDARAREFHYEYIGDLRVGDRVAIEDGELHRL